MKVIVNLLVNTASSCRWSTSLGHNLLVKWVATETAFYPPELHLSVNVIELHRTVPDLSEEFRAISGFPSIIMIMLLNHEHARICWHWLNVGFAKDSQPMWKSKPLTRLLCSIHISLGLEYHTPACTMYINNNICISLALLWPSLCW